jgi:hypothetical protein
MKKSQPQRSEPFPNLEARKTPENVPELPWFVSHDEASDCPPHTNSGLAKIDTGRESDWPIARLLEWPTAQFIVSACTAYANREQPPATDDETPIAGAGIWRQISRHEFNQDPEDPDCVELFSSYGTRYFFKLLLPATDDRVKEQCPHAVGQEWTVAERPSGLEGVEGMPPTCLQIMCGETAITHGLEVTRYNRHLLQESCDAHNAELAVEREKSEKLDWLLLEAQRQLLQAQAAIAEALEMSDHPATVRRILKSIDLSALDKHDEEVRQDQADRFEHLIGVIDEALAKVKEGKV